MSTYRSILARALMIVLIAVLPSTVLVFPQRAHAIVVPVAVTEDLPTWAETTITAVKSTISAVANVTSAAATYATYIKDYVLEPIAFITSGNLIRSLTAGVIDFVNGKTNSTGQSQFVQDLQGNLKKLSDNQASAFLVQFGKHNNSPFAASIGSSLRNNYYQDTSLAGFFAKNRNTLPQFSSDPEAFLRGDWSKGGVGAWMALTTRPENNPYLLHQRAQEEMALMIESKTAERLNQLSWGSGFMSWCGGTAEKDACNADGNPGTLQDSGLCLPNTQKDAQGNNVPATPDQAGDPCIKKDGTPGKIQTPGSVIKSTLDKALGLSADKIAQMGNTAAQINQILSNISSVMDTVNFASGILGSASVSGLTGGLAGSSDTRPDGISYMDSYKINMGAFGVTQDTITHDAAGSPTLNGEQYSEGLNDYETYWKKIKAQADKTAANLALLKTDLGNRQCFNKEYTLDATAIDRAVASSVTPVFDAYTTASTTIADGRAFLQQLKANATSSDPAKRDQYVNDLRSLQTRPPTARNVAQAEQESQTTRLAVPTPADSYALDVSDGTVVDRLQLLIQNSDKLRQACFLQRR